MFKWVCYATALVFAIAIVLLVYDLKSDVTRSLETAHGALSEANHAVTTVNAKLPEIVAEVKKGTETLSSLAADVELIKSVAGMRSDPSDRGLRALATYADEIQKVLADKAADRGAVVLVEEILGSDLKEVDTLEEFLVGLNKEMIAFIVPLAKSKQEILYRASHSGPPRRKPFYIQFPNSEPVKLQDFIKQHPAESAQLPPYEP